MPQVTPWVTRRSDQEFPPHPPERPPASEAQPQLRGLSPGGCSTGIPCRAGSSTPELGGGGSLGPGGLLPELGRSIVGPRGKRCCGVLCSKSIKKMHDSGNGALNPAQAPVTAQATPYEAAGSSAGRHRGAIETPEKTRLC